MAVMGWPCRLASLSSYEVLPMSAEKDLRLNCSRNSGESSTFHLILSSSVMGAEIGVPGVVMSFGSAVIL